MATWVDNNWVWQLFLGLPETQLNSITSESISTLATDERLAHIMLTVCQSMAEKIIAQRAGQPWPVPPSGIPSAWPNSNWVWQLFQGMETDHLERIIFYAQRADLNVAARVAYVIIILFEDMAEEAQAMATL